MVSNPIIVEQLGVLLVSSIGVLAAANELATAYGLYGDRLSAFRLKLGGQAAMVAGGGMLGFLILRTLLGASTSGFLLTLAGIVMCAALFGLGYVARNNYVGLCIAALEHAEELPPFQRLQVYRTYASSFSNAAEPLRRMLEDIAGLRLLKELADEGVLFNGKPIAIAVADWCGTAEPATISRALEVGLFDGKPRLEAMMERAFFQSCELKWESILARKPGAPQVGHTIRGMIEEAIARQNSAVDIVVNNRDILERSGRLAVNAVVVQLQQHLERVHLKGVHDASDAPGQSDGHDARRPAWTIELNILESGVRSMTYKEQQSFTEREAPTHGRYAPPPGLRRKVRTVEKVAEYPLLRVLCTIRRAGRDVVSMEADTRRGLEEFRSGNLKKAGLGPANTSAGLVFSSLIGGVAMHIHDVATPRKPQVDRPATAVAVQSTEAPVAATVEAGVEQHRG